jgi:SAM-dependent methyltransferase
MPDNADRYYDATAEQYDEIHGGNQDLQHVRALELSWPILERLGIGSVLDVGCGTGRSLAWYQALDPRLELTGVDPSRGLLSIAAEKLPAARLELGRGEKLGLESGSVDLAVATGIMHHVDRPANVIGEMFRVARKAVLISDHNNFAFGGSKARRLRLWLHASGLLGAATYVKQGFRKQGYSDGDGWWYPYSLLNDFGQIAGLSAEQYIIPTTAFRTDDTNMLLSLSHMAIVAVKPGAMPA